jgi:hypothetical protein
MPFEGLMSETVEDVTGTDFALEPTHSDEDETFYVTSILSGEYDDAEQDFGDYAEDVYDPDGWQVAQDRWERSFWGD